MTDDIPDAHPRSQSLKVRHKIIDGMHSKIVAEAGLIAHGRGEAFDYLIGEHTHDFSRKAIKAAAAYFYLAKHPIISVNGNVTVLCPSEMIEFSTKANIPMEINIFYRKQGRLEAIEKYLKNHGAGEILGLDESYSTEIEEVSSQRRIVDTRGIGLADVVFVPLEDGDRTEGLIQNDKIVITVDLNPLSRTSKKAHVTIVDNIIRVFPLMLTEFEEMTEAKAKSIIEQYDNKKIIQEALDIMSDYWKTFSLD